MSFDIKYDKSNNELVLYDISDVQWYQQSKKLDFQVNLFHNKLLNELKDDVSVFLPIDGGNDFLIKNASKYFFEINKVPKNEDISGMTLSNAFPYFTPFKDILKDAFLNGDIKKIVLSSYESNKLLGKVKLTIVPEANEIFILSRKQLININAIFKENINFMNETCESLFLYESMERILADSNIASILVINGKEVLVTNTFAEITGLNDFNGTNIRDKFRNNIVDIEEYEKKLKDFYDGKVDEITITPQYKYKGSFENVRTLEIYLTRYDFFSNKKIIIGIQDITSIYKKYEQLKNANHDKNALLKEVHHRVKNNLQILNSFLSLEERFHKDDSDRIINNTKNRLKSLALMHEQAYTGEKVNYVKMEDYLNEIDAKLFNTYNNDNIKFIVESANETHLPLDLVTPLTLIINELTINSLRYAFVNNQPNKEIFKSTKIKDGYCRFIYRDNGVGLPKDFDINTTPSLGWTIIKSLTKQLDGKLRVKNDNGMCFVVEFPVKVHYKRQ